MKTHESDTMVFTQKHKGDEMRETVNPTKVAMRLRKKSVEECSDMVNRISNILVENKLKQKTRVRLLGAFYMLACAITIKNRNTETQRRRNDQLG